MSFQNNIIQYQLCVKCNSDIAKIGTNYCKKCQVKPTKAIVKKEDKRKIYYYKFQDKDTKARVLLNDSKNDIGYSLCIQPYTSNTKDTQSVESYELFLLPNWNQFRSLNEFTSCITKSSHISFQYFIISCSSSVQNLPKFQHFIKNKVIDLPSDSLSQNLSLPYPITNPLQLLCQASFWNELISTYFEVFHPMCPLFSIRSFNKNSVSPCLLSAIYFCAYQISKIRPKEVSDYMEKLEIQNIKIALKNVTIDNLRALVIHTFMAQWRGKFTLAKSLQAHLSRMSYLHGFHLNCSQLSSIDRYNRGILFTFIKAANVRLSGSQNFSPNYLPEFGYQEPSLYDPKWQLPISSSPIYFENQDENQLYAHCLTQYFKFSDNSGDKVWFPSFLNKKTSTFNRIWNSKTNAIKSEFEKTIQALEELKLEYSQFQHKVDLFEFQVRITYHESMINMYEIIRHKNKSFQPDDIENILYHCHQLYQALSSPKNYNPVLQYFAHIVGLHYINIYPKCTEDQKQITKQRLQDLILYMKDKFLNEFSLNYLILKTGFDLLDNS